MARSHFSYEKRRKELDKKKKKEAKKQAKAERKAAIAAGEVVVEPIVTFDEFGNVIEVMPDAEAEDVDTESDAETNADETDPA